MIPLFNRLAAKRWMGDEHHSLTVPLGNAAGLVHKHSRKNISGGNDDDD